MGQSGDEGARLLLRTLKRRSDIAALVKEVRLGTYGYSRETTKHHAKIITICPNSTGIDIWGWNGFVMDTLIEAIRSKKTLTHLAINKRGVTDSESDTLCSPREFMDMMNGWPELEWVKLHSGLFNDDDYDTVPAPQSAITNPRLRYIRLYESNTTDLDDDYLRDWSIIAPAVEQFAACFHIGDCAIPRVTALNGCLSQWSQTLRELTLTASGRLYGSPDDKIPKRASIDDIFCELTALRVLETSEHFVLLSNVFRTSAPLEELYYGGEEAECEILADHLRSPLALPNLRVLQMKRYRPPTTENLIEGECFPRFLQGRFLTLVV